MTGSAPYAGTGGTAPLDGSNSERYKRGIKQDTPG